MPVLLVHGVPTSARLWRRLIDTIDRKDEVVAVDLPGFAAPAPAGWVSNKENYVAFVVKKLEELYARGGPVHLVGHDWGCLLSLRAASLRPELLRSVAAGNGPIDENWPLHALWESWNELGAGEKYMAEVLTPEAVRPMLIASGFPPDEVDYNSWNQPGNKQLVLDLYRSAKTIGRDWGPDLAKIVVPSMIIWGQRDLIVPIEFGRRMATRMGAEVVAVEGDHFWPFQCYAEAAVALKRLWARTETQDYTIMTQRGDALTSMR